MRSCFDGYLTEKCSGCPFWADGTDDRGIDCAIPAPIMSCPAFAKAYKEDEEKRKRREAENENN